MSHHNKIQSGSEKPKLLQYPGNIANNNTATKRGCAIDNGSSATKKIKLDVGNNQPMWNTDNITNKASLCDGNIDEVLKLSSKKDSSIKSFTIAKEGESSTEKGKLTICNLGRTISEIAPTSPLNSDDYVLFTSDISDFIDDNDCVKSKPSKPLIVNQPTSQESIVSSINLNATVRREANNKSNPMHSDSLDIINMPSSQSSTSNEIELVLLPSAQENKSVSLQTTAESPNLSASGTRIVGQSNSLMRQGTVTYTRITTPGTVATGLQSSATVLNRMNVSSTLKSQQLMVTTKKLTSEVTQTTAKVSIGNTTISVPLLKSLNSSQIIHAGNLTSDLQKHVQPTTVQTNSPQAQINFSKILNVKRGQKGNQPKIVSLSQLQIKPVSAKLVQAKVLSQKLSQVQCTVTTNSNATSLVAITTAKAKQNIALSQHNAKKLSAALAKQETLLHASTEDDVNNTDNNATLDGSDAIIEKSSVDTCTETLQKVLSDKSESTQLNMCTIERPLKVISPVTDTDNVTCKTTVKKVVNPNVNILPLLTPLSKNSDQQGATGLYPAVSIIRQSAPQLITTSATGTCVSVSTNASDTNVQTEFHGTKSPININAFGGKINTTPIISMSRNISLLLAKNNINQQGKATIVATKNVNTIDQKVKKINLSVSSALNVAPVNVSQGYSVTSQPLETGNKQAVISVTVQPSSFSSPSDQTLFSRKTVKVTPYTLSTVDHHIDKRLKPTESHEQEFRQNVSQNSQNADILPAKRSRCDNQQAHVENSGENNADTNICDKSVNTFVDKTNAEPRILSPSCTSQALINSSTNSKTEESNNVLLKQLLQNSNTSHSSQTTMSPNATAIVTTASMCNQVLSRKVINLRAPSLGLVSSLEQQLARPVIPPVPATTSTQVQTDVKPKLVRPDHHEDLGKNANTDTIGIHNEQKSKPIVQVISKETSFVSNPNVPTTMEDSHYTQPSSIKNRDLELKPIKNSNMTSDNSKMHSSTVNDVSSAHLNVTHKDNSDFKKSVNPTNDDGVQNSSSSIQTKGVSNVSNDNAKIQTSNGEPLNMLPLSKEKQESHIEKAPCLTTYSISSTSVVHDNIENNDKHKSANKSPKLVKSSSIISESATKVKLTPKQENTAQNIKNVVHVNMNEKRMSVDTISPTVQTLIQQSPADRDAETRKKKKREYQKHRRQLLNNKECQVNAANPTLNLAGTKKRARKISKVEEDYDNFIDNLMTHLRQMKPLQVLEPLLNRNFVVCSTYGMSNSVRVVNSKENGEQMLGPPLLGEYGNAQRSNVMTIYDSQSCEPLEKAGEKHFSTIQNDFYDQEFSSNIRNSDYEKLFRIWGIMRERNVECSDIIMNNNNIDDRIFPSGNHVNWISVKQLVYPGLVIMNNKNYQYLGRMSPSLPLIEPTLNQKKCLIIKDGNTADGVEHMKQNINAECNIRAKSDDSNSRMVTLSLPLSAVNNVFGVLKDLANLLHIPPPTIYKVIDTPTYNLTRELPCRNSQGKSCINLQPDVLCGRRKVCYSCGLPTDAASIRAYKTPFCDTKQSLHSLNLSPMLLNFCSKLCHDHFKGLSKSQTTNSVANFETQIKTEPEQSDEKFDASTAVSKFEDNQASKIAEKEVKNCRYKHFSSNCFREFQQFKHIGGKDVKDMLPKTNNSNSPDQNKLTDNIIKSSVEDTRQCVFCYQHGDGVANGPARLLNFDIDKWVHLNCALWSSEVYETISGGLMNFQAALQMGLNQSCCSCQQLGATVRCFKNRCGMIFHLPCAIREQCVFYKNKTIHCQQHATRLEKENELTSLIVQRRVFVERDENRQVATVMHHSELPNLLRVGTLIFLNIGQLLAHQLEAFHNMDYIYPVGYKVIRFYWSMKKPNKRCRYVCSIAEVAGRPEFRIQVQEQGNEIELRDSTPNSVWQKILTTIAAIRKENKLVKLFPQFVSGEDLFGLTEPSVIRIIESLPGIETLTDYRFKYGRNPLLELPLAINPSGAARTEPKQRQVLSWRKPHTQRTGSTPNQRMANTTTSTIAGEIACPYSKQFVHSKSSQYKKMKQEWRNNVYLARSKIQGLGLYAARDIEKHTMIIEYIGEVIRTEVSEIREKQYEAKNRGIYMFRLDEDRVVDATLSGGLARYINHACNPNCVTETVDVDRELRIIIFAKRRINRGEELSYDYKFDIEDDAHKISCMCGSPNCRKWMN